MIDQAEYLSEMFEGVQVAFSTMQRDNPHVEIYSISVWTDVKARKSAISFDTFKNSEEKRAASNAFWQQLRDRFTAEKNVKRLASVPPDSLRNDNPADFEFRNVIVFDNDSLTHAEFEDEYEWRIFDDLMDQVKAFAAKEAKVLKLHPEAELGICGKETWYHKTVKLS